MGIICVTAAIIVGAVLIFQPKPAEFKIISITLHPVKATVEQPVTVLTAIKNVGDKEGTYKATLIIDGIEIENKEITIAGGETKTATFTVAKEIEGTYSIGVGGLTKSLEVKGLRTADLKPKIGDKWQYRFLLGGITMLMDVRVKRIENVTIGQRPCEAFLIKGSCDIEDFGNLLPEGVSVTYLDGDVTMYREKEDLSHEMIIEMVANFEYLGVPFRMKKKAQTTTEIISGGKPDKIEVGDIWNTTQREVENTTTIIDGEIESETTEFTVGVNYECTRTTNVSVQAGTFYCYEVKDIKVGDVGYSLCYYSVKTKLPVKLVEFKNGQITAMMELVSYSVS